MPIDLELKKENNDSYYTIVSAMPHNEKIKGAPVFDGSTQPSSVAADGSLMGDSNNKGGVVSPSANAKTNTPSAEVETSNENISRQPQSDKPKITAEEAHKEIDALIKNALPNAPTKLARELGQMALRGIVTANEVVNAANKLLNGNEDERKQARKVYDEARDRMRDKYAEARAIKRLNEIADKFPALKPSVELDTEAINRGDKWNKPKTLAGMSKLAGMNDDELELQATYALLSDFEKSYSRQFDSLFVSSVAKNVHNKAYDIYRQAKDGEIPTKGLYKRVEEFLNAPHEGLLTDNE